ncbi:MAG: ABC transporter substrate-binding protein [Alphaproteobacteria bacterium]|nr:ABC transporter substrate-binding protein [Alphaproteobacteria bacterium]
MRHHIAAAAVAALAALAAPPAALAQNTVKVGAIGPLSGPAAASGIAMRKAWEFVAADVNAQGGLMVDGKMKKIEMLFEDSQSRPEVGVSAAQKLLTRDNVDVLVGELFHSHVTLAIMELAPAFPKIFFTGQPVSQEIARKIASDKKKYGNYWKFSFNSDAYADTTFQTIEWLIKDGKVKAPNKTFGFVTEETDYAKSNIEFMRKLFEPAGWKMTGQELVPIGHGDFYPQISKLRAAPPDVLISIFTSPNAGAALVKQMKEQGVKPFHFAIFYPTLREFLAAAGPAAENLVYSPLLFDPDNNAKHKELSDRMQTFLGSAPSGDHAFGYCNAAVLFDAIKRAGAADVKKLGAALAATDFPCTLGRWVFDPATQSPRVGPDYFAVPAAQVQNGTWRAIWPASVATSEYKPQ